MTTEPIYGTALYYPFLHVGTAWLKWSLLYWDDVRRIVPDGAEHECRDDPEVANAADEGCLLNTDTEEYLAGAETRFCERVLPLLDARQAAVKERGRNMVQASAQLGCPIHAAKITSKLTCELQLRGLAHVEGDWILAPNKIATLYMTCLGAEMSERIGSPLVTDARAFAVAGEYLRFGEPPSSSTGRDSESMLLRLGLSLPSPKGLSGVPMRRILRFRDKHQAERRNFRTAIESIVAEASTIADPNRFADFARNKEREVQTAIDDHRKTLDELNVDKVVDVLSITCPAVLAAGAVASWIGGDPHALQLGGVSIAAIGWWAKHRGERRQAVRDCPWHYYLEIERRFGT